MFLGSLFHDVEKRSTTRIEDGRIVSPGHAKKGEVTTRNILYRDFDCNFSLREQICKVVRHHGLPLWIFDKQSPIKSIVDASLNSKNYFLYLIAKADILGRFCLDKEEMLYRIELFKEYANEYDLLYNSKEFFNEHTKSIFFEQDDPYIEYVPFENNFCSIFKEKIEKTCMNTDKKWTVVCLGAGRMNEVASFLFQENEKIVNC